MGHAELNNEISKKISIIGNLRVLCTILFAFEFLLMMIALLYLRSCYEYKPFYTIGLPPTMIRLVTSIFCMYICFFARINQCRWMEQTLITKMLFGAVSITIMSLSIQHDKDPNENRLLEQYYFKNTFFFGTAVMLFYFMGIFITVNSMHSNFNDLRRLQTIDRSPFVTKQD